MYSRLHEVISQINTNKYVCSSRDPSTGCHRSRLVTWACSPTDLPFALKLGPKWCIVVMRDILAKSYASHARHSPTRIPSSKTSGSQATANGQPGSPTQSRTKASEPTHVRGCMEYLPPLVSSLGIATAIPRNCDGNSKIKPADRGKVRGHLRELREEIVQLLYPQHGRWWDINIT